jgi:hypothetical protein
MPSDDDSYDERLDDANDRTGPVGDRPDHYAYDDDSGSGTLVPRPAFPWGWPPSYFRGDQDEGYENRLDYGEESQHQEPVGEDEDDSWLGEGMITLLIVAGAVLFLFPEPATSALGIVLLGIGVFGWLADLAT